MREASNLDSFRQEVRTWLAVNCPAEMRQPLQSEEDVCWGGRQGTFQSEAQRQWLRCMAERGWTVPTWPREYGGGGLSEAESAILSEELKAIGARSPLASFGIWMLGPALLKYGNEEQKREHLPRIARGEIRWCQGYSEPGAGSDLAALQTRAQDMGDHFLVNGQKIWTSYADKADWIFCLVRTTQGGTKQAGISFLLFDMTTPGVSTRPIVLISGASPFCETFFDNVKVPKSNLVGEIDRGWDIAKYLLSHERESLGSGNGVSPTVFLPVPEAARLAAVGQSCDPLLRAAIARAHVDFLSYTLTLQRLRQEQSIGAMASMLKYYGSELNKRMYELLMDLGGAESLQWDENRVDEATPVRAWLRSKGNSIEGGTSEIQLSIIAKALLSGQVRP